MKEIIIWDYNPLERKNFECRLDNQGKWKLEEGNIFGKWIMTIRPKEKNVSPTIADLKNFLSGLIEVEKRNDKFIFENGKTRNIQMKIRLDNFKKFFEGLNNGFD